MRNMDTQKVKKGILFAIPTIMFGYAGDKLAFAWRITEGTNWNCQEKCSQKIPKI